MRKKKGLFITFEKTKEGLGGTTQSLLLHTNLKKLGIESILTREPGGTQIGHHIRKILLDSELNLSKATTLFLMAADRSQHYKEILKPTLKQGGIVISDRYFDSMLAYQGSADGWKTAFLMQLHQAATGSLTPDLTFILDGTPYRQLSNTDSIECKGTAYHAKVEARMQSIARTSVRYIILNANQSPETLGEQVLNCIKLRYPSYFSKLQ